jgi:hypothetical protein
VWKVLRAPESACALYPEWVVHAGYVPGTPQGTTGEIQYRVLRHPDERFTVDVDVVTELVEGAREATQRFAPPHRQFSFSLARVPDGTRLDLASRYPALSEKAGGKDQAAQMAAQLQKNADACRTLVEGQPMKVRPCGLITARRRGQTRICMSETPAWARAVRMSYRALPNARAPRIAKRSGSSDASWGRAQRVW